MNIALVLAGGVGSRTNQELPKQFINVNNKPILIYTLEKFQKNKMIDGIIVVCTPGWEKIIESYSRQYKINKLLGIAEGGKNRIESIVNGVESVESLADDKSVVVVHDSTRPLVDDEIINDGIEKAIKYGGAMASFPCYDTMFQKTNGFEIEKPLDRTTIIHGQTPESYQAKPFINAIKEYARQGNMKDIPVTNIALLKGMKVVQSKGSRMNFKITTKEDIELMDAIVRGTSSNLNLV